MKTNVIALFNQAGGGRQIYSYHEFGLCPCQEKKRRFYYWI